MGGAKYIDAAAPLDRMPLYVRAGAIVPMGPEEQYSGQKPADPIELRVYPGADGHFTIYEDEGDTYDYQKGKYATIPLHWNDASRRLTIGARKGSFPGMLQSRTFQVVLVGREHGVNVRSDSAPEKVVAYAGGELSVEVR